MLKFKCQKEGCRGTEIVEVIDAKAKALILSIDESGEVDYDDTEFDLVGGKYSYHCTTCGICLKHDNGVKVDCTGDLAEWLESHCEQ